MFNSPKVNSKAVMVYHAILRYMAQNGFSPSIRDLMRITRVTPSTSTMASYIKILREWHWIEMDGVKSRAIRLTRPTEAGLTPAQLAALLNVQPSESYRVTRTPSKPRPKSLQVPGQTKVTPKPLPQPPKAAAPKLEAVLADRMRRRAIRSQIQPYED